MDDERIAEIFEGIGPVTIRKMFGGKGVYFDGQIVGVALSTGEVLLKADKVSAPDFEAAGAERWAESPKGRKVNMPYWSIPERALDDPDEMAVWAQKAYEAALRSAK
ncbi:MAG: TfoX/Sxy family protein [Pseudaminobacter sp.]|nr:TfoX/Sxy family protein [Pseudaminobacter sp.]